MSTAASQLSHLFISFNSQDHAGKWGAPRPSYRPGPCMWPAPSRSWCARGPDSALVTGFSCHCDVRVCTSRSHSLLPTESRQGPYHQGRCAREALGSLGRSLRFPVGRAGWKRSLRIWYGFVGKQEPRSILTRTLSSAYDQNSSLLRAGVSGLLLLTQHCEGWLHMPDT